MTEPLQNGFWQSLNNSTLLRFLLLFACGWAIVQLIAYFYSVIAILVCLFATAASPYPRSLRL